MVRNPRLAGWFLYGIAVAAFQFAGAHLAALHSILIVAVTGGGAILHAVIAARTRGPARRVWVLGTVGLLCWAVVETRVGVVAVVTGTPAERPVWAHVLNLGALLLAVAAMFAVPSSQTTASARLRMLFDGAASASALVGMVWMFILSPMIKIEGSSTEALLNLAYPVIAVGLMAVAFVLLASQRGRGVHTLTCVSGGVVTITATLLVELLRDLAHLAWLTPWVSTGMFTAAVLLAIAPLVPMSRAGDSAPTAMTAGSLLPYLPAALLITAMAAFTATDRRLEAPVLWSGLAVMGAVLGRQFLALRLTAALGRDLERQRGRLAHEATHDALTGLPNRSALGARLGTATAEAALLMIDLDGFKAVNDTLGHPAGDELLRVVAGRLLLAAAPFEPSVLVSRLGGDEFAVLLPGGDLPAARGLADRILAAVAEPVPMLARTVSVRASIGIAVAPDPSPDLMRDADLALYSAKEHGKGCHRVFEASLAAAVAERTRLEADLADAIAGGQLEVAYQPVVDLGTGATVGAEALVRWCHPGRGPLLPAGFLPVAEELGLLPDIDRWVLATACEQAAAWRVARPGFRVGVNLSAAYLATGTVTADVARVLAATGLPGAALTVEVTETALGADVDRAAAAFSGLRSLGVRVALDDFGVGYSSLAYLRRLPVDTIKIDRSFIQDLDTSDADTTLVRTVITLARDLGLRCVAEGVETAGHAARLRALGCGLAQGYHFTPPLRPAVLDRLLRDDLVAV
jgi:diguanylate cyclase